ncbi:putative transporter SVOPL isoform X5 [Alosa alosa]|uniref:putative transporter SVOPL isoform X5 n=1 Tax=Alosa alosa TaxID=278164 RepID=UPI0020151221|nr:putative transporter SVOPL isoform X5 [Alosa alosa]
MLFIIMGSANIIEAMEIMLLAVLSPEIRCEWRLDDWQVALVSTMVFFGYMLCGVTCGYVADRYGRWTVPCRLWSSGNIARVCAENRVHSLQIQKLTLAFSQCILDDGIYVNYSTRHDGGSNSGLEMDDTDIYCSQCCTNTAVQVHSRVSPLPGVCWECCWCHGNAAMDRSAQRRKTPPRSAEGACGERGHGSVLVSSTFRRTSVLLWYTWFVASFSYYGSVLGSSELLEKNLLCVTDADPHTHIRHDQQGAPCYCVPLTNDDYITLLFSSLGEVVLIPLNIGLLSVTGRKHSMALVQLLSAAFFMLLNVCSTMFGFTVLLFLLRAVVAMNFNVVYIYTAEVYPTAVRSIGMGVCTSCSRIGGMLAPFIAQVLMSQSVLLAMLPFALACLLSAVGTLLLPIETRGRALLVTLTLTLLQNS